MSSIKTVNPSSTQSQPLATAYELKQTLALPPTDLQKIRQHRQQIKNILNGSDPRLLVIVGPCSIHDPIAVVDYAQRLEQFAITHRKQLKIVMRAYLEKPRSTIGWKGYVYDPYLGRQPQDAQNLLQVGLYKSRELLLQLATLDLALATEVLNPMLASYFDDLYSWGAIGARTSESQIHREIASSLDYAIGFKNGTDGNVDIALDACVSASQPHGFFGISQHGTASMLQSAGNDNLQLILRGSQTATNYDIASIQQVRQRCQQRKLNPAIIVDCSHGNSQKDPSRQVAVLHSMMQELQHSQIRGLMLESHLEHGNQAIHSQPLRYGCSITDGCLSWLETEQLLGQLAERVAELHAQQDLAVSA